jgi:hypothetical protein
MPPLRSRAVAECTAVVEALLQRPPGEELPTGVEEHLRGCLGCRGTWQQLALIDAIGEEPALAPPPFDSLVGAARTAARRRRQARLVRRGLPTGLAVISAVLMTVVVATRVSRSGDRPLAAGEALEATATGHALLPGGVRVTVGGGKLVVERAEPGHTAVRVLAGSAFLDVPPVAPGGSLAVHTEEAEVRVRGTRFEVARSAEGTRVTVIAGVVEVRPRLGPGRPFFLRPGQSALVGTLERQRRDARAAALAALGGRRLAEVDDHVQAWLASAPPPEEAAEAHAVVGWKLSAQGDGRAALERFRRALALLPPPAAPLWADNAAAQLALLVERTGGPAASAWHDYLTRFPDGAHRALARQRLASRRPGR